MKQEIKTQWITALRSGQYKQAHGMLGFKDETGTVENCCLGVLCNLAVKAGVIEAPEMEDADYGTLYYDDQAEVLPNSVMEWAELGEQYNPLVPVPNGVDNLVPVPHSVGNPTISLAELNDGESYADHEYTFNEIADVIEENL